MSNTVGYSLIMELQVLDTLSLDHMVFRWDQRVRDRHTLQMDKHG